MLQNHKYITCYIVLKSYLFYFNNTLLYSRICQTCLMWIGRITWRQGTDPAFQHSASWTLCHPLPNGRKARDITHACEFYELEELTSTKHMLNVVKYLNMTPKMVSSNHMLVTRNSKIF